MKKLIVVLALILVAALMLPACVSRTPGDAEDTTTSDLDIGQILDDLQNGTSGSEEAVAEVIYKAYDDHAEVVGCKLPVGNVEILSEFEGKKVTKVADGAFHGLNTVTSIVIPEGVTSIGEQSFMSCSALESISLPASLESIGKYAFYGCISLKEIEISAGVKAIGDNAFGFCNLITEMKVSASNPNYTVEDGVLFSADKTTLVCYPTGKADESYTIPASVTTVNNFAFAYVSALTSVSMSNVTSLGDYTFGSCSKLANVDLGTGLTYIGAGTFQKCTSLVSITIPEGVTSIGYKDSEGYERGASFYDCTALTTITLPSTLQTIYLRSFDACTSLNKVIYKGGAANWSNVTIGEDNTCLSSIGVVDQ
ncbi:MAG: leucine-rich repeat domain-containing protein [Clostridia bacterium]|nr:leucine-rich repeat domain-containing protein [Clostridia bacterium]